jgi:hypothetical protein
MNSPDRSKPKTWPSGANADSVAPEPQEVPYPPSFPFVICPKNGYFKVPRPSIEKTIKLVYSFPFDIFNDDPWKVWYTTFGWFVGPIRFKGLLHPSSISVGNLPFGNGSSFTSDGWDHTFPQNTRITMYLAIYGNEYRATIIAQDGQTGTVIAGSQDFELLDSDLYIGWPPLNVRQDASIYGDDGPEGAENWNPYMAQILSIEELTPIDMTGPVWSIQGMDNGNGILSNVQTEFVNYPYDSLDIRIGVWASDQESMLSHVIIAEDDDTPPTIDDPRWVELTYPDNSGFNCKWLNASLDMAGVIIPITVSSIGEKTFYAWVKNGAGLISAAPTEGPVNYNTFTFITHVPVAPTGINNQDRVESLWYYDDSGGSNPVWQYGNLLHIITDSYDNKDTRHSRDKGTFSFIAGAGDTDNALFRIVDVTDPQFDLPQYDGWGSEGNIFPNAKAIVPVSDDLQVTGFGTYNVRIQATNDDNQSIEIPLTITLNDGR